MGTLENKFPSIEFPFEMENTERLPFKDALPIKNCTNMLEFDIFLIIHILTTQGGQFKFSGSSTFICFPVNSERSQKEKKYHRGNG